MGQKSQADRGILVRRWRWEYSDTARWVLGGQTLDSESSARRSVFGRAGAVIGLVVLSHWLLDFVSHPIPFASFSWRLWQWSFGHPLPPDLPLLFGGSKKVGLGLYNMISALEATALELGMLLLGFEVYMRSIIGNKRIGLRSRNLTERPFSKFVAHVHRRTPALLAGEHFVVPAERQPSGISCARSPDWNRRRYLVIKTASQATPRESSRVVRHHGY